jgi:hypothetical protein
MGRWEPDFKLRSSCDKYRDWNSCGEQKEGDVFFNKIPKTIIYIYIYRERERERERVETRNKENEDIEVGSQNTPMRFAVCHVGLTRTDSPCDDSDR